MKDPHQASDFFVNIDQQLSDYATHTQLEKEKLVLEQAKGAVDFSEMIIKFVNRFVHHTLPALIHFSRVFPPLWLTLTAIKTLWDIVATFRGAKKSHWHRTENIAFTLLIATCIIVATLIPPISLILLTVGAGIGLFHEALTLVRAWRLHRHLKNTLQQRRQQLEQEQIDDKILSAKMLHHQVLHLEHRLTLQRKTVRENTLALSLAIVSIAGLVCLFFPPLIPLGLSVLLAATLTGILTPTISWLLKPAVAPTPRPSSVEVAQETWEDEAEDFNQTPQNEDSFYDLDDSDKNPAPVDAAPLDSPKSFINIRDFTPRPAHPIISETMSDDEGDDEGEGSSAPHNDAPNLRP